MDSKQVFFDNADKLATLFTEKRNLQYGDSKYFNAEQIFGDDRYVGCKFIEVVTSDIKNNLQFWSFDGEHIFYQTEKCWYVIAPNPAGYLDVTMAIKGSWWRVDDFMNTHSCTVGKEWLKTQKDKYVKMFAN